MKKIYYLYAINFLAAFLMFQVELMMAKIFLPGFGGSYLVWGACVVFFQCVLLIGYLYSHITVQGIGLSRYRRFHLFLVALPLLFFMGNLVPTVSVHRHIPLVLDVFFQLAFTIGLAFFVLSTISVFSQSWLAVSVLPQNTNPFMLYALSNAGSFLGLLSYPFIFEYFFGLDAQFAIWRTLYFLFVVLYFLAVKKIGLSEEEKGRKGDRFIFPFFSVFSKKNKSVPFSSKIYWLLLAAAGCVLFLSVTNVVTYEITPCPLLWVIPLGLYLLSFVLTFRARPFYPAWLKKKFHLLLGLSALLFFLTQMRVFPILLETVAYFVSLFYLCIFCHYHLYQDRPRDSRELTLFYLIIALGGFLGSVLVTWVVPLVVVSPLEYLGGLLIITVALRVKQRNEGLGWRYLRFIFYLIAVVVLWPFVFRHYNVFGLVGIFLLFSFIFKELGRKPVALSTALLILFSLDFFVEKLWGREEYSTYVHRNYYGIYKVGCRAGVRWLYNGTTVHGGQFIDREKEDEPIIYYHRNSPISKLFGSELFSFGKVGGIGLGTGTIAAFVGEGQTLDFFELDPDVLKVAGFFSYIKKSKARINFIFGDARLSLKESRVKDYDILVMDAFSGDSIPAHLLTMEAIEEYRSHLRDKGIILFHISNRYVNLAPVLFSNAAGVHAFALINVCRAQEDVPFSDGSTWMILTWDAEVRDTLVAKLEWKEWEDYGKGKFKLLRRWTDNYSHILSALDVKSLLYTIRDFRPFYW